MVTSLWPRFFGPPCIVSSSWYQRPVVQVESPVVKICARIVLSQLLSAVSLVLYYIKVTDRFLVLGPIRRA